MWSHESLSIKESPKQEWLLFFFFSLWSYEVLKNFCPFNDGYSGFIPIKTPQSSRKRWHNSEIMFCDFKVGVIKTTVYLLKEKIFKSQSQTVSNLAPFRSFMHMLSLNLRVLPSLFCNHITKFLFFFCHCCSLMTLRLIHGSIANVWVKRDSSALSPHWYANKGVLKYDDILDVTDESVQERNKSLWGLIRNYCKVFMKQAF